MEWVKKNLFFVIPLAIAVILLGVAVYKYFGLRSEDNDITMLLEERAVRLREMYEKPIFPSAENLRAIENDQQRLLNFINQCKKHFQPVPELNVPNVQALKTELDRSIYKFNESARKAGVTIPTNNFAYSFDELVRRIDFSPFSIKPIAIQLSEIDKILEILFNAKINTLEFIQRARVCPEDRAATASAGFYIADGPITNSLGIIYPYRITFRCFSSELAEVINGFAHSPYGFVIKAIDVDPGSAAPGQYAPGTMPPGMMPQPGFPPADLSTPSFPRQPPARPVFPGTVPGRRFPGTGRQPGGGTVPRRFSPNQPPSFAAPPPTAITDARTNRTRVVTLFNERPFRVTMLVHSVRLM